MLRGWARWLLFLSSYTPLFVILLIKDFSLEFRPLPFEQPILGVAILLLVLLSWITLAAVIWVKSRRAGRWTGVKGWKPRSSESMQYVAAYIIPFLNLDLSDGRDVVSLLLMIAVVGLLYVNSDLVYINPSFAMLGYRVYESSLDGEQIIVISKERLPRSASQVVLTHISDNIYWSVEYAES